MDEHPRITAEWKLAEAPPPAVVRFLRERVRHVPPINADEVRPASDEEYLREFQAWWGHMERGLESADTRSASGAQVAIG